MSFIPAIDVFIEGIDKYLSNNFCVLCNHSSTDNSFTPIFDILLTKGFRPKFLMAPEHGYFSTGQYMESITDDDIGGIPVVNLYGESEDDLKPDSSIFDDIDTIVIYLADIGTRYYTYCWTIAKLFEVISNLDKKVVLIDHPNPINASKTEGGIIQPALRSFVGYYNIPNRHGMTIGEIAQMVLNINKWDIVVNIIQLQNYERNSWFDEYFTDWINPSPNMHNVSAALLYPGQCLLEGTNVSEGRGTTRPFEFFGAPFINTPELLDYLKNKRLPGVTFRPIQFIPQFDKWKHMLCNGLQIHITDRNDVSPLHLSLHLVGATIKLYGDQFKWRTTMYEFRDDVPAFDLLIGNSNVRQQLEAGDDVDDIYHNIIQNNSPALANRELGLLYT
jgi:uncharacterized protein YbbC (DUF1343 family)